MAGTSIPVIYNDGHGYRNSSGTKDYPYVEYYVDNDTLRTTNKAWSSILLNEGQEITVMIDKDDNKNIKLYTFFNYWLPVYTIVLFIFLFFIGYGLATMSYKEFTSEE